MSDAGSEGAAHITARLPAEMRGGAQEDRGKEESSWS